MNLYQFICAVSHLLLVIVVWDGRSPESEKVKSLLALRDLSEHTRRRRRWTRAFNTAALKGYEVIITNRVTLLVENLEKHAGPVDLAKWIQFFTCAF